MTLTELPARPGSRAAQLAMPRAVDALKQLAREHGVCIRPVLLRRTDLTTGGTEVIDLPCGATREDKCPPCAKRARRLRQQQCREGWHRTDEPLPEPHEPSDGQRALIVLRAHFVFERGRMQEAARWDQVADLDAAIDEVDRAITESGLRGRLTAPPPAAVDATGNPQEHEPERKTRRTRSTRRRQDAPDLPRHKVNPSTLGRRFTGRGGTVFQPSTFLTLTLDSYGRVGNDGTPVNPGTYDYRRAAWDAVHFPALLDRFWQNARRAAGANLQYLGAVEPQRRLAPHAHFAMRGTIPRDLIRRIAAATYHQVWWPSTTEVRYPDHHAPRWDADTKAYVDPDTRQPLPTWDQALDALDAEPIHVARFGPQVHAEGVLAGTKQADKLIGYLTKYLTKAVNHCHAVETAAQRGHLERLWHELRYVPCSPRCANWLRYGVQPKKARPGQHPGKCKAKVHQRTTLGMGGRRVLVSRQWSGKTLADHRHDTRAWVRSLLGISTGHDQADAVEAPEQGRPAPVAWEMARPDDPDVAPLQLRLLRAVSARIQQRAEIRAALDKAVQGRDGPGN